MLSTSLCLTCMQDDSGPCAVKREAVAVFSLLAFSQLSGGRVVEVLCWG